MRTIWKLRVRPHRLALALAVAAVSLAAPLSGASAAIAPGGFFGGAFPLRTFAFPGGTTLAQGTQAGIDNSVCGVNRPSVIGSTGGTQTQACFSLLTFIGPSIGQINSQVGPTIIGSTILGSVTVSAGSVVNTVP
jgi:hypothetical protein